LKHLEILEEPYESTAFSCPDWFVPPGGYEQKRPSCDPKYGVSIYPTLIEEFGDRRRHQVDDLFLAWEAYEWALPWWKYNGAIVPTRSVYADWYNRMGWAWKVFVRPGWSVEEAKNAIEERLARIKADVEARHQTGLPYKASALVSDQVLEDRRREVASPPPPAPAPPRQPGAPWFADIVNANPERFSTDMVEAANCWRKNEAPRGSSE
jgi:hypothetical protein